MDHISNKGAEDAFKQLKFHFFTTLETQTYAELEFRGHHTTLINILDIDLNIKSVKISQTYPLFDVFFRVNSHS